MSSRTINYLNRIQRIENLIQKDFFDSAGQKSFKLLEQGMKDIYHQLYSYLEAKGLKNEWDTIHSSFEKRRGRPFRKHGITLGSLVALGTHTNYLHLVKEMCTSNLKYVRTINWEAVREKRNQVIHEGAELERYEALEILFWTKVFLYDVGLLPASDIMIPQVLDGTCPHCHHNIAMNWNYCATCGTSIRQQCIACGKSINSTHKICPHCDHKLVNKSSLTSEKAKYMAYVEAVWSDFVITPLENQWLEQQRLILGLSPEEAEEIRKKVIPENITTFSHLLEATLSDGHLSQLEKEYLLKKADFLGLEPQTANVMIHEAVKLLRKKKSWNLKFNLGIF